MRKYICCTETTKTCHWMRTAPSIRNCQKVKHIGPLKSYFLIHHPQKKENMFVQLRIMIAQLKSSIAKRQLYQVGDDFDRNTEVIRNTTKVIANETCWNVLILAVNVTVFSSALVSLNASPILSRTTRTRQRKRCTIHKPKLPNVQPRKSIGTIVHDFNTSNYN